MALAPSSLSENYVFPSHRLRMKLRDDWRTPVVLVACGSFSPITYLHLRMFEMARDYIKAQTNFEVVGGYLSPVNDAYKKPGLLSAGTRRLPLFSTQRLPFAALIDSFFI